MPEAPLPSIDQAETPTTRPTQQDIDNARIRREVAARQQAAYDECLRWAASAFGPGWFPCHRHFLVEHDEEARVRYTGERPKVAATVYTVRNDDGESQHFTVENGAVVPHAGYQEGFGSMLLETHPTRGFVHQGKFHHVHRYSLCFAPYELYDPKTVEQLVALRASRERKREHREDERWTAQYPLFARAGFTRRDG